VAPVLILVAVALLLAQKQILAVLRSRGHTGGRRATLAAVFVSSVYGAYFGAALGVLLLALLSLTSAADFPLANAVKARIALVVNLVAAVAYAIASPIAWQYAAVLAVTSAV